MPSQIKLSNPRHFQVEFVRKKTASWRFFGVKKKTSSEWKLARRFENFFQLAKSATVNSVFAEGFLDAEKLVVFGDAIRAAHGASFDLASVGGHRDVGDGAVLGFP